MKSIAVLIGITVFAGIVSAQEAATPRAARSVHLRYPAPEGVLFYNEIVVEESVPGSYFMACGWNTGYFGIQELSGPTDKVVLFSVWDPTRGDRPDAVPAEQRVEVLFEGEGVKVSRFGGEGTGGKSMFKHPWKVGETNRFLVQAQTEPGKTAYTAYFYLNDKKEWKKLASFRTITKGTPLKDYYSFVEDFRRDGKSPHQRRRALFANGWVKSTGGDWISLARIVFTGDNTPLNNVDAGVAGNGFYLATGGDVVTTNPLGAKLSRMPVGISLPVSEMP